MTLLPPNKELIPGTVKLKEIGEGCLYIGGSGQHIGFLEDDPIAEQNRRFIKNVDTAHLSRYDYTNFCQWYGRKSDVMFHPFGKIMLMELVDEQS